jgi:integrase/recombinase XerD
VNSSSTYPPDSGPSPKLVDVIRVWRANHYLSEPVILTYSVWVRRFRLYCCEEGFEETSQLTLAGVCEFANEHARLRGTNVAPILRGARCALHAWAHALEAQGYLIPQWKAARRPAPWGSPLLAAFAEHLRQHQGISPATINNNVQRIKAFLEFLRARGCRPQRVQLSDIDAFIIECSGHLARSTVAKVSCSIRGFLRFLRTTGRISADLAPSVVAPIVRKGERPVRALPWTDVQRILRAIDRSSCRGKRDYTMLLLMSTYGLGAKELFGLTLDDIDWHDCTLRIVRSKTGVEFLLPLLAPVARALVTYLRHGRPAHAKTRHLFLSTRVPYAPLSAPTAVRFILGRHAKAAGVATLNLGTHVLRHSHACRQVELGTRPKIIGDILGHRDPESLSVYVRVASERLRKIALPVPQ